MNPILSSTIDFDNYLQGRLATSRGQKSGASANTNGNSTMQPVRAASRGHPPHNSDVVDNVSAFLQVNAQKYDVGRAATSKGARPTSARKQAASQQPPHQVQQEVEAFEFVHSWKKHVATRPSPVWAVDVPCVASTALTGGITRHRWAQTTSNSNIEGNSDSDNDSYGEEQVFSSPASPFLAIRIRTACLRRHFQQWAAAAAKLRRLLQKNERLLCASRADAMSQSVLRLWFFLALAERHHLVRLLRCLPQH
jgi:hypothetical protein